MRAGGSNSAKRGKRKNKPYMNDLTANIDKLHTTKMGAERIKRNLSLTCADPVAWCKEKISDPLAVIDRKGKNWYAVIDGCVITVNAYNFCIITAHKIKVHG